MSTYIYAIYEYTHTNAPIHSDIYYATGTIVLEITDNIKNNDKTLYCISLCSTTCHELNLIHNTQPPSL